MKKNKVLDPKLKEMIEERLPWLTEKEAKILKLRFGLCGYRRHTLEEIGYKFKVTRQTIWQKEKRALRNLGYPLFSRKGLKNKN